MFHQTPNELILLSHTFQKELDDLKNKGYRIGGKPDEQTFLFKLDGSPSLYDNSPTSPFFFFIKDFDIMSLENVKDEKSTIDKLDYSI